MKNFILIAALLSLAACGFHPMYGVNRDTPASVESRLENVQIGNIPNREGVFLRNALVDRFYRNGEPAGTRYVLSFTEIREEKTDLDITKTADATRGQLRLRTSMTLVDKTTGQELLNRDLTAITSYNIVGSEFATRVTEQNAREDALNDLARQTEMQIALYLKKPPGAGPQPEPPKPQYKLFDRSN